MRYRKKLFPWIVSRQSNSFLAAKYTSGKEEKADYSVALASLLTRSTESSTELLDSRLRSHVDGVKRVPRLLFLRKHIRHRAIDPPETLWFQRFLIWPRLPIVDSKDFRFDGNRNRDTANKIRINRNLISEAIGRMNEAFQFPSSKGITKIINTRELSIE